MYLIFCPFLNSNIQFCSSHPQHLESAAHAIPNMQSGRFYSRLRFTLLLEDLRTKTFGKVMRREIKYMWYTCKLT